MAGSRGQQEVPFPLPHCSTRALRGLDVAHPCYWVYRFKGQSLPEVTSQKHPEMMSDRPSGLSWCIQLTIP